MSRFTLLAAALVAAVPAGTAAIAQPFEPGPPGSVPGSSVAGARIDGAPRTRAGPRIRGAEIFGDTVEERAYGRPYDDSYLRPRVPRPDRDRADRSSAAVATEGRSDLNPVNAGEFATEGPNAIGRSSVTRGQSFSPGGRARIVHGK